MLPIKSHVASLSSSIASLLLVPLVQTPMGGSRSCACTLKFVALLRLNGKKHQLGALNSISFKPGCHFCNYISMENMKFAGHGEYGKVVSPVFFLGVSSLTSTGVFGFTHNTTGSFPGERYSVHEDLWDRHARDFHL